MRYALVGYDKDNDAYEVIVTHEDLEHLKLIGRAVSELQKETDCFRRRKYSWHDSIGEPFDWFMVVDENNVDYPYPNETYWASYDCEYKVNIQVNFSNNENGCYVCVFVPNGVDEEEYISGWLNEHMNGVVSWSN